MKYLLLAAAATALFFGAYWLLMRREKRHQMVRFYLLGTLLLALLLRNERGEEVWHIQQLDDVTLVFVDSDIFTYHGGDSHARNTYTYRRKK